MLRDGYTDVPAGKLAAVVTCLEMRAPPERRADPGQPGVTLERAVKPDVAWYRDLYRRIGADWLWASRLAMEEGALARVLEHPQIEVHAVMKAGQAEGLLELDFREEGACELAFFGLTQAMIGGGTGRWLMNRAVDRVWSQKEHAPVGRFWVHTCTLDSPQALGFYIRSGFVPVKRQVEVFDDPRLLGVLPEATAPRVPILRP